MIVTNKHLNLNDFISLPYLLFSLHLSIIVLVLCINILICVIWHDCQDIKIWFIHSLLLILQQRWTSMSRTIYWTGLLRGTLAPHRNNQDPLPPPPTILCGGCSGSCRLGEEGKEAKTGPRIPNCPAPRGGARGSWGGRARPRWPRPLRENVSLPPWKHIVQLNHCIRESVDSLCRDGTDTQYKIKSSKSLQKITFLILNM